ncbi:hypothetical protein IF1G_06242 [Cordyceps javanica]|uniref:Uncharacterized protein n=1 Tax=Cordyceps javanica TaxID=43265 RepID=A0A545V0K9_9HYPO|nr:hypothetical protein IF1G_06242 [Cordyceps javanica]
MPQTGPAYQDKWGFLGQVAGTNHHGKIEAGRPRREKERERERETEERRERTAGAKLPSRSLSVSRVGYYVSQPMQRTPPSPSNKSSLGMACLSRAERRRSEFDGGGLRAGGRAGFFCACAGDCVESRIWVGISFPDKRGKWQRIKVLAKDSDFCKGEKKKE